MRDYNATDDALLSRYFASKYSMVCIGQKPIIGEYPIDDVSQAECDRLETLTRQTLNRITWEEPIDQNSQEFKDWKAHILSLIEEARRAVPKK